MFEKINSTSRAASLTGAVLMSGLALQGCAEKKSELPNFIIIHMDDMGYGDLTATGATGFRTPNIDRLCAEGMRFTNFYASQAVSSASRAGLLTGCYPNRIGFAHALNPNSPKGLNPEEETIAELLKKKDYTTSCIGKWHLGDRVQFLPLQHGFDEYFGLPYSNDMWPYHPTWRFPDLPLIEGNDVINPKVQPEDQELLTTWYTEHAVDFIDRNADGPFFLYLAHSMPHVPLYVSEKFKGKSEYGIYGDVMMEIDWSVGEVMKALERNKIGRNTLVIFTSDNGPWLSYGDHAGSAGGLREGKGTSFEGGQRVPCIVWWPDKVPAGIINNRLASAIDLLPTIGEIAGVEPVGRKIDGVSIASLFFGDTEATPREHFLYYYQNNNLEAVRNDRFKLVFEHMGRTYTGYRPGKDGKPGPENNRFIYPSALYDLARDPGERYDVAAYFPEVVEELNAIANAAREDLGDDLRRMPGKNRRPAGKIK